MKNKTVAQKILFFSFIIVICLSWILNLIMSPFMDDTNYENREKAKFEITDINSCNNWINDHLPFRNKLVELNSLIDCFLFRTTSDENVKIGKDNWLFYSHVNRGDSIGCWKGKNLLSEEQLQNIANNCVNQKNIMESQGKEFVIFIGPNKEEIYGEYIPSFYGKKADYFKTLQIVDYLKKHTDVRIVYPYREMLDAKKEVKEDLYYSADTHWNQIGGYVGASCLLKELGIETKPLKDLTITKKDHHIGDLSKMLGLVDEFKSKDYNYSLSGYSSNDVKTHEFSEFEVFSYSTQNADPRKIYIWRDSFTEAMAPYIAANFNDSYMRHFNTYSYEDLEKQDPDIVVYEVVERNIDQLGSFSFK